MRIPVQLPIRKRQLLIILGVLFCVIIAIVLLWPKKSALQTERQYYQQQVGSIKNSVEIIQAENDREIRDSQQKNRIETYQGALVSGLGTCQQIEGHIKQMDKTVLKSYQDKISQLQMFCNDFKAVADYGLKSSKATRQFVSTDIQNVNDLKEIVGYTKADLEKLKSSSVGDPGLGEQITSLDTLQKRAQQVQNGGSQPDIDALFRDSNAQKTNILTSRNYFWNNTIRIEAIHRSIIRIQSLFDEKSNP
ncbi:MAG: hypothetical protein ACR2FM_05745 [Candidatus Saccharimonadales bacterium]